MNKIIPANDVCVSLYRSIGDSISSFLEENNKFNINNFYCLKRIILNKKKVIGKKMSYFDKILINGIGLELNFLAKEASNQKTYAVYAKHFNLFFEGIQKVLQALAKSGGREYEVGPMDKVYKDFNLDNLDYLKKVQKEFDETSLKFKIIVNNDPLSMDGDKVFIKFYW